MKFDLNKWVRPNIVNLQPYSSARKEFTGAGEIFLDANENSFGSPALKTNFNRYPDPLQIEIKEIVSKGAGVSPAQIFVGNGSDEAIDLLFRIFCRPGIDEVITTPPTYGMYEVSANINDVKVNKVLLDENFELNADRVLQNVAANTKLIFLCSPNNPTGNDLNSAEVLKIIENFAGVVIVDEAYQDFSRAASFVENLKDFPNLVVLRTFSKAWGMAGLRVGMALASREIIKFFNKVKPPYNVSEIAQQTLIEALRHSRQVDEIVAQIIAEREKLKTELLKLPFVLKVFPSAANFVLVKTVDADSIYRDLVKRGIIVRNRSNVELCEGCLRITVGTPDENEKLLEVISKIAPATVPLTSGRLS